MTGLVEPLPWDSEFFGVAIGRVDLTGLAPAALEQVDAEVAQLGIRCLYGTLEPRGLRALPLLQDCGYRLMEVSMDLDHRTSVLANDPPTASVARIATLDDVPALAQEIAQVAPWSRYAIDERFGVEAAARMQQAWIERAARGDDGRILIIAEDAAGPTGFSTQTSYEDPEPRIDLIASSKVGSGAAQALVRFAFEMFDGRRSWGGPIAARNIVSLRFCENMGYRVAACRYHFHRWFDEG